MCFRSVTCTEVLPAPTLLVGLLWLIAGEALTHTIILLETEVTLSRLYDGYIAGDSTSRVRGQRRLFCQCAGVHRQPGDHLPGGVVPRRVQYRPEGAANRHGVGKLAARHGPRHHAQPSLHRRGRDGHRRLGDGPRVHHRLRRSGVSSVVTARSYA